MSKVIKLGLGNFIKSSRRLGKPIGEEIDVAFNDISGIHNFLSEYQGFFNSTYFDDIINPAKSGISGETILVSDSSTTGMFFNSIQNRPKTVAELFIDISKSIDVSLGASDIHSELLSIKDNMGANIFDKAQESSDLSLDKKVEFIDLKLAQIASDCFNRGQKIGSSLNTSYYNIGTEGKQTQSSSLRDLIDKLIDQHGGLQNLGHSNVPKTTIWTINMLPTDIVSGGEELFAAPFGSGYSAFNISQKFYNPMNSTLKISKLYAYIDQSSIVDNLTITVYKNGAPTEMLIHSAGGALGPVFHVENEVLVEPNSYIQFKIKAGTVSTGSVHLNNISLILQEIS